MWCLLVLSEMEGIRMYVLSTELKGRFPMIWTNRLKVDGDTSVSIYIVPHLVGLQESL